MRKGVILAGGKGSRLHPLTLATSKQLLPIYDKPMIYYPLSVLMLAGIRDVMIISTSRDLIRFQNLFGDGSHLGIQISYGVQDVPRGIADAFLVAEGFIGNDDVALILGDNIFYGQQMYDFFSKSVLSHEGATIFAYEVADPSRYGVIAYDEKGNIREILEKPQSPPSNHAVTGLYFYDNRSISFAKELMPSARGELEITDINNIYLKQGQLQAVTLGKGFAWFDSGDFHERHKASSYVQITQDMHNTRIACLEEIAFQSGWIDEEQLSYLAKSQEQSEYGRYLEKLLEKREVSPV